MKGHDIGKGVTILRKFNEDREFAQEDLATFYAPSECYPIVERGFDRKFRTIKKKIKGVTGLKFKVFSEEIVRRTSSKWAWKYL
jgi:hypothetical protein